MYERMEFPSKETIKLLERPKPQKEPDKKYLPFYVDSPFEVPRIANFGEGFRFNVTSLIHDVDGFPTTSAEKTQSLISRLHTKIESRIKELCLWDSYNLEKASVVLCSYGATARSCLYALKDASQLGLRVGMIKLKTLWPFPDFVFDTLSPHTKTILVCEMNMGQILREVKRAVGSRLKVEGVLASRGTLLTPQEIVEKIKDVSRA
jgi:2-oxoglutarate ferredoxin oxidoreductase subunit alpha